MSGVSDQPGPEREKRPPETGNSDSTKTVGEAGATIARAPETLLVVRKSFNALDFIDTSSGRKSASVEIGIAPHEVSVSPDGRRAVISNYGAANPTALLCRMPLPSPDARPVVCRPDLRGVSEVILRKARCPPSRLQSLGHSASTL